MVISTSSLVVNILFVSTKSFRSSPRWDRPYPCPPKPVPTTGRSRRSNTTEWRNSGHLLSAQRLAGISQSGVVHRGLDPRRPCCENGWSRWTVGRAVRTACRRPRPAGGERAGVRGTLRQKDGGVAEQGPTAHGPGRIVAARPHAGRIRVVDTHSQPATGRLQIRPPGAHRPVLRRFRLSRPALIVELDGGQHAERPKDRQRDSELCARWRSPNAPIRTRKITPHPGPLPASGARELIDSAAAVTLCEKSGLARWADRACGGEGTTVGKLTALRAQETYAQ